MSRNPFRLVSELPDSWTDAYTGEARRVDTGSAPEVSQRARQQRRFGGVLDEGEDKRHRHVAREGEEQEAEIVRPQMPSRKDELDSAAKMFIGRAEHQAQAQDMEPKDERVEKTDRKLVIGMHKQQEAEEDDKRFQAAEGIFTTAAASSDASLRFRLDRKEDTDMRIEGSTNVRAELAEQIDLHDPRLASFAQTLITAAASQVLDAIPLQGGDDRIANELVWDILTQRGEQAAGVELRPMQHTQLAGWIKRRVVDEAERRLAVLGAGGLESGASALGENLPGAKREALETRQTAGAPDLQLLLQATNPELKNDTMMQERVGTWALHVLSGKVGVDQAAVRKGLKADGLQALGRLTLELLAASKAAGNKFQVQLKPEDDAEAFARGLASGTLDSIAKQRHDAGVREEEMIQELGGWRNEGFAPKLRTLTRKELGELLRNETAIQDLQTVQMLLPMEYTADQALDALRELLADDTARPQDSLAIDILSGGKEALALFSSDARRKTENVARSGGAAAAGTVHEKQVETGQSSLSLRTDYESTAVATDIQIESKAQSSVAKRKRDADAKQKAWAVVGELDGADGITEEKRRSVHVGTQN